VSPLDVDPDSESYDILDETLSLFRANTFFRNFEIKGPADRLLIYGILFISECLNKVKANMDTRAAEKALINGALEQFAIPGDANFPLNQAFEAPNDRMQAEQLRGYLSQVRQELAMRLHQRLYEGGVGPTKVRIASSSRICVIQLLTQSTFCSGGSASGKGNSWVGSYDKVKDMLRRSQLTDQWHPLKSLPDSNTQTGSRDRGPT
jgi:actin related protein 2/3 complex, subunit 3